MKCHIHITSIKRIPWLKGQIHALVSAEVGQPCNFRASAQNFCCEQWLSNFPTRLVLYCLIFKWFTNNTFTFRASLQYLACITPLYRGENKDEGPQFPLPPDALLQTPYAEFSEHLLSSQYGSIDFAAAKHSLLHIHHPMRLKLCLGNSYLTCPASH